MTKVDLNMNKCAYKSIWLKIDGIEIIKVHQDGQSIRQM